jgi:hypothetical protein
MDWKMRTHTASERVAALLLGGLLVSCGVTRSLAPTSIEELSHLVLFIQGQPDGTVTHSWKRAEELDLGPYRGLASSPGTVRRIVPVMGWNRDCDEENRECVDKCLDRPLPPGFGHITSGNRKLGGKAAYCRDQCRQAYIDCGELEKLQPQEFVAIDTAIDWLKRNRKTILVGSVVIIAGVAFVVVSAGVGLVILAPALLLAAPGTAAQPVMARGSR